MQTTVNVKKRGTQRQQFISGTFMFNICLVQLKMLRDQSNYLQESVGSTSPSPSRERLAKTSPLWYKKLREVDGKRYV